MFLPLPRTPELAAIVTGHGKIKAYMHRFKLTDNPVRSCNISEQTSEHTIYECRTLEDQRRTLQEEKRACAGNSFHP